MDNGAMHNNPLISPIWSLLRISPEGLSEHALIKRLQQEGLFADAGERGDLALFQKHFLVMNALYQLQAILPEEGFCLQINPLSIRLISSGSPGEGDPLGVVADEPLRRYYLDWDNLTQTSESDVAALLRGFWDRYYALDRTAEALILLGLCDEDALTWTQIQRRYRQLVAQHHPDKGGDPVRFIEAREAYELLRQRYVMPGRSGDK